LTPLVALLGLLPAAGLGALSNAFSVWYAYRTGTANGFI
jgi:hypothetical protein